MLSGNACLKIKNKKVVDTGFGGFLCPGSWSGSEFVR
jgi:hypothetical protein